MPMNNPNKWQDHKKVAPQIVGKTIAACKYISETEMQIKFTDGTVITIGSQGYSEHELHWNEE